jgi:hypothetical protein
MPRYSACMLKLIGLVFVILALVSASFAVTVSVSSPAPSAAVVSPVTIHASASGSYPITGWRIYVDGVSVYSAGATQTISVPVAMSTGTHQVIVRVWDSSSAYGSSNFQVTAGAATASAAAGNSALSGSASTVAVSVSSPGNGASVASPATISAAASSGAPITGWQVYVDGVSAYSAGATPSISAAVTMASGSHQVIVRAWNSTGVYGSQNLTLTVGSSSAASTAATNTTSTSGPTPPANAKVFSNIQQMGGWGNCASSGCSGSSASVAYWMAQNQTSPSLDGISTEYYINGKAWADVLWHKSLGPVDSASNFLLDYWLKPNADANTNAIALEFDIIQAIGGRKWDMSNECHFTSSPHWDTWDGAAMTWIHTNVPCPKLDPNTWHHVQIYAQRIGTQTHNVSYTVDNNTYPVPTQYAYHNTQTTSWADSVNVQVQLDTNANGGTVSEYIDKMTLYAW